MVDGAVEKISEEICCDSILQRFHQHRTSTLSAAYTGGKSGGFASDIAPEIITTQRHQPPRFLRPDGRRILKVTLTIADLEAEMFMINRAPHTYTLPHTQSESAHLHC